ncbi:hypothetical protein HanXRQr2_Chr15g0680081 [Helianthus annuus]|uniref:Uncharacterized protein n=1 Tax=Helianthus annuus TaxID=4232 RepID=A0A9K3DYM8_HELAN|nr:hypothetical protein HanXRQr2_Chr15g0680081 [Helianthus annuus]KAJ0472086.1 hypothetical protein HanHA89_Chr15g0603071 [Helianthus annuus]KAJ0647685.1 hypothetical protein HanLR1_Chr15g0564421 [Helianthus annuus]
MEVEIQGEDGISGTQAPAPMDVAAPTPPQGNLSSTPNRPSTPCTTPSKSLCMTNQVPPYVPTPIKNPDFDSEFAMEEEGWCTDEEEEITTHESLNQIEKSATVYDLPIPFPPITNLSVDGKRPELNVGDKPDVQTKVLQPVGLNVDFRQNNVWENHGKLGLSIADRIRRSKEAAKVRIEYFPPVKTPEGKSRMLITKDDLLKSAKAYTWHLYGYFLGTDQLQNHEAYNVNVVASFLSSYKDHLEPAIANLRKLLQSLKGYQYIIVPDEEFLHDIKQRGNTEQEYLDAKAKEDIELMARRKFGSF